MLTIFLILISICTQNSLHQNGENNFEIICSEECCKGTYVGQEFINGSDVAHQFSNHMANRVGDHLKELYASGRFVKVDLDQIQMSTQHLDGIGEVIYKLEIPFERVETECEARTSFDHRGGWGHQISKESVLKTFEKVHGLEIEEKNTPEGLQEFWIQWRHSTLQSSCIRY